MKLSAKLRAQMNKLSASSVHFDEKKRCFVDKPQGKKKRGLTKMLSRMLPVPQTATAERKSSHVTTKRTGRFHGAVVARCTTCDSAVSVAKAKKNKLGARLTRERNPDKAHGVLVDEQLQIYVRDGRAGLFKKFKSVDPCVGTLLEQLDAEGLVLIGSQIPIYCAQIDIATAIDLLATDRAKREKLVLIEIKATRTGTDIDYELEHGVMSRGAMTGLPLSYYGRHQTQLLCMQQMLQREHGIEVTEARVMRLLPGCVYTYKLDSKWYARRDRLFVAIIKAMQQRASRKRKKQK
jgi:hypothetical protein